MAATRMSDGTFLALAGVFTSLFAADAYLVRQLRIVHQDTARLTRYVSASMGEIQQDAALINDVHQVGIEALAEALAEDRQLTETAAADARAEAQRYASRLANNVVLTTRSQVAWFKGELSVMRATAMQMSESALHMASQLREARSSTRATLAGNGGAGANKARLQMQKDLLAASVARERIVLSSAVPMVSREEFEFHLRKSPYPYYFKYYSLRLDKADQKRNRYTLEVLTDNQRIETVDSALNEPVRLVASKGRGIELVVREIGKDEVRGMVVVPGAVPGR